LRKHITRASQEYDRIVSEADKKAGEKLEDAKAAAEKEHSQMIADAKDEIAGMVIEASDKMTASKADPETDHALFEKFISETKKKSQ
jgi:F-type H+-transporting ATPase subunit b